jgi:hypothetical protein
MFINEFFHDFSTNQFLQCFSDKNSFIDNGIFSIHSLCDFIACFLYWLYEFIIYQINIASHDSIFSEVIHLDNAFHVFFQLVFQFSKVIHKFSIPCNENASGISGVIK